MACEALRRTCAVLAAIAAVGLLLGAATSQEVDEAQTAPEIALRLIYTADIEGYLQPCGCEGGQLGGLAGLATVIERAERVGAPCLVIHGGGVTDDPSRAPFIARALAAIGFDVLALTQADVASGLSESFKELGVTTLTLPGSGAEEIIHVGERTVRVALGQPRPVAADGSPASLSVFIAEDDFDANVMAAENLATSARPAAILGRGVDQRPPRTWRGQNAAVVETGHRGYYATVLDYAATGNGLELTRLLQEPVTEATSAHPVIQQIAEEYYRAERERLLVQSQAQVLDIDPSASLEERPVALAKDCATCHAEAYDKWAGSAHATALQTLGRQGRVVAECVPCHSEFYRRAGALPPPGLPEEEQGLTCMTCHGAGRAHALTGQAEFVQQPDADALCISCHSPEQQIARFDLAQGLARIRHW